MLYRVSSAFLVLATSFGFAYAQTAPAAAGGADTNFHPTYGPPVSGICVLSRDAVLTGSKAGQSAGQQIQMILQADNSRLAPEREALVKADKELTAQKSKLSPSQYQKRVSELQSRAAKLDQQAQADTAQLRQAQAKALTRIAAAVNPALATAISAHKCSMVVEIKQLYGVNPAMDLTSEVTQAVDAALPPFKLDEFYNNKK